MSVDGEPLAGPEPRVVYALNKPRRRRLDRARHARAPDRDRARRRRRPAPLPGRAARRRQRRADPAHERRRAGQPPDPPALRGAEDLPRARRRRRRVGERALRALREGVELEDGPTAPAQRAGGSARDVLELTIAEGRNRQVRRMCEAVGHPVLELTRVAFGPLRLGAPRRRAQHRPRSAQREIAGLRRRALTESRAWDCSHCAGPTTVERNDADAIVGATTALMQTIMERNELAPRAGDQLRVHGHAATSTPSSRRSPRAPSASSACRCCARRRSRCRARCRA